MKRVFIAFLFLLTYTYSFAENKDSKRADKLFEAGDYESAIEAYSVALESEEDITERGVYRYKMGVSYGKLNRPDRAEKYFNDAIKYGYMGSDVYLALGETQQKLGKYDAALSSFEAYKLANPGDPLGDVRIVSCQFAKENLNSISSYDVVKLDRLNSSKNDFGVSYFNESLLFTSTRSLGEEEEEKPEKVRDKYEERVIADKPKKGKAYTKSGLGTARVFLSVGSNGRYNKPIEVKDINKLKDFPDDGIMIYDPYSKQALYSKLDGKVAYIQAMELKNNKWVKGAKIDVKTQGSSIGHPFKSPDGNKIYFTSTMPGGYGKSDIWYIKKVGQDSWSAPINAGENINTQGNEVYPSEFGDYFFFASDGRIGFGGFDIYASKVVSGTPGTALNLGAPFNSPSDDYNISIRSDLKEGVLTSTRNTKTGDDIYRFVGFPSNVMAMGSVVDINTKKPISNVTLEMFFGEKSLGKTISDERGQFLIPVSPNTSYTLKASVPGYNIGSKTFKSGGDMFGRVNKSSGIDLDFALTSNSSVISGRLYDRLTAVPIEGQVINLITNGIIVQSVKADPSGIYKFTDLKNNTTYSVKSDPKNYFSDIKSTTVGSASQKAEYSKAGGHDMDLALEKYEIGKEVIIKKISFQEDKANLLSESYKELDRLADMFSKNPQCTMELTGYVSSKVNSKIANELSLRRVNAVRDYLVSQKVSPSQLKTKAMGRNRPLINNPRTVDEHEQNNRITYAVTKVDDMMSLRNDQIKPDTGYKPGTQPTQPVNPNVGPKPTQPTQPNVGNAQGIYRVQIAALRALDLKNQVFVRLKTELGMDINYELGPDGLYRYFVGGTMTRAQAEDAVEKIKAKGIVKDPAIKAKP